MRTPPIEEWINSMELMAQELTALNKSTEEDFLALGAQLNHLSGLARNVTATARDAVSLITDRQIVEATEALQRIFHVTGDYLSRTRQGLAGSYKNLSTILEDLTAIHEPLSRFKKTVKHLRIFGVSIKIESARIGENDNGFHNLASDVENLSSVIAEKTAQIMKEADPLYGAIDRALSRFLHEEAEEHDKATVILEQIRGNLSSLDNRQTLSSGTIRKIEDKSGEIGSDIGEIVTSLQFHDITRQQIDHVREGFEELKTRLRRAAVGEVEDASGLSIISSACMLHAKQLSGSHLQLLSAAERVIKKLREIEGKVYDISREIANLLKIADGSEDTFLSEVKEGVSSVMSSLKENARANGELKRGIGSVAQAVNAMTAFVEEIEDIGLEIELIALNASVRAAHTGSEGQSLGVLAEAIRNLSENTHANTTFVSDSLKKIGAMAKDLGAVTGESGDGRVPEVEKMAGDMRLLLDVFEGMNSRIIPLYTSLGAQAGTLGEGIGQTIGGITILERVDTMLRRVITALEAISSQAKEFFPASEGKEQEEYLREMEGLYTMEREREIQRHACGSGSAIEEVYTEDEECFGSNVELF